MEMIPTDVIKEKAEKKGYERGYSAGLCAGELTAIIRIKKGVKKYIDQQQKLWDDTDGEQGQNFANSDVEELLMNLIMGVKQ